MDIQIRLETIRSKVLTLLDEYKQLKQENIALNNEIKDLQEKLSSKEKSLNDLENKSVNLQSSKTIENEDINKLKAVINELITEIDKGLELLKS